MEDGFLESRIKDLSKITRNYIIAYLIFINHAIWAWEMPRETGAWFMNRYMFILFLIFSICIKIFFIDYIKYIKKYITKNNRTLLIIFIIAIALLIIAFDIISIIIFKLNDNYFKSINTMHDELGWFFNKVRYGNYYYPIIGVPIIYLIIKSIYLHKKNNIKITLYEKKTIVLVLIILLFFIAFGTLEYLA